MLTLLFVVIFSLGSLQLAQKICLLISISGVNAVAERQQQRMSAFKTSTRGIKRRIGATRACATCRYSKKKCVNTEPQVRKRCDLCEGYGKECSFDTGQSPQDIIVSYPSESVQSSNLLQGIATSDEVSVSVSDQIMNADQSRDTASHTQSNLADTISVMTSDNSFIYRLAGMDSTEVYVEGPIHCAHGEGILDNGSLGDSLPDFENTCRTIDTYFSTVHVAYPFICQPDFRGKVCTLYTDSGTNAERAQDRSFLANFNLILAIGSFYQVPLMQSEDHTVQHVKYFVKGRSMVLSVYEYPTLTYTQSCLLLTFYLLLSNKPRSAWQTLSNAVGAAQVLNLNNDRRDWDLTTEVIEIRRRVWFSIHILETLLASMLGFSMQSHRCLQPPPPQIADFLPDGSLMVLEPPDANTFSRHFYFIEMISFSTFIGETLDLLYWRPSNPLGFLQPLEQIIEVLDAKLIDWRDQLPSFLNFTRPHLFTNDNVAAKRQRNNLALKYHNIRILVHRKALLSVIDNPNQTTLLYKQAETCVMEAISTVKLFDNLPDVASLYLDYPHWQLRDCLMTTGIVLVFGQRTLCFQLESLSHYFEACVKLMKALSADHFAPGTESSSIDSCAQILYELRKVVLIP